MNNLPNILFSKFTRVNETVTPEALQPNELTQLENMRLDEEIGVASTRKGFARYHEQANTSGVVNNIYDVIDENGDNYLLSAVGTKLRKNALGGAGWVDVKTGLTEAKLRMAVYGTKFYFTNYEEVPFYTDLTDTYDMEIERPDVTDIGIVNNGGGLNPQVQYYILVYITSDGQESNCSNKFGIIYLNTATERDLTLSNLPVSTDARVVSKKIYRTKEGSLTRFYLLDVLDNAETGYDDIIMDDNLDTTDIIEYKNTPDKCKYIVVNQDRMFLANNIKLAINRVIPPAVLSFTDSLISEDANPTGLDAGVYQYARSIIDAEGNESELIFLLEYTLATDDKELDFIILFHDFITTYTDLSDLDTVSFNKNIKYIRYYRTKAGGDTFYKVYDYPPSDYSVLLSYWTDDKNDSELIDEYPANGNTHIPTEELTLKSSVIYSNIYKPLEFPELNYIEVYPDDGDEITGIFDDDNGNVIFKTNSICKLYTNGHPANWSVTKLVTNMGCDEPDSIYKYGGGYFFVYRNKPYYWASGALPQILGDNGYKGFNFATTFNTITSYNGSTFWDKSQWYVLAVQISSDYYLLCYDTKLGGWYKFTIDQADVVARKEHGTDKDKILIGGNLYVTYYNESATSDSDSGTTADINVSLITKDYTSGDPFIIMRLMFLFINYYRKTGALQTWIKYTLRDSISSLYKIFPDTNDSQTQAVYQLPTDRMIGSLQRSKKLRFEIAGASITKFYGAKLEYIPEEYGIESKIMSGDDVFDTGKWII